jgi:hypothetical protein
MRQNYSTENKQPLKASSSRMTATAESEEWSYNQSSMNNYFLEQNNE